MAIRSEPNERDILTRIANLNLASQAASVRMISRKKGLFCVADAWVNIRNSVAERVIDSIARRVIRRCECWRRKRRRVRRTSEGRKKSNGENDMISGGLFG